MRSTARFLVCAATLAGPTILASLETRAEKRLELTELISVSREKLPTASIAGSWIGSYSYISDKHNEFTVTFDPIGRSCRGRSEEPNTFRNATSPKLFADLTCDTPQIRPRQKIRIIKKYDGTGGVTHSVTYFGVVSDDMTEIYGEWATGKAKGIFTMRRQ